MSLFCKLEARLLVIPLLLSLPCIQHDIVNQSKMLINHFEVSWACNYTST